MAIKKEELETLLAAGFSDGIVTIEDLAGDDDHYRVTVLSQLFEGKGRIQQHQMVYAALKGKVGEQLHALSLKTGPLPT